MPHAKSDFLKDTVQHIDIKSFDARPIVDAMGKMAFQARNLTLLPLLASHAFHTGTWKERKPRRMVEACQ